MADALLSPAVGATMWAVSGVVLALCARRLRESSDDPLIPLMGVLGAFIFAAQMINFSIPATGSSGHLGGGLLLAALLGPQAAFVVIASVLTVQALFFADGGLLALGANIFNLGVLPCFLAYPLVYRPVAGDGLSRGRVFAGSVAAAVVALQLGSLAVVVQTVASGITSLPFAGFLLLMQPVHLAIGIVEGLATAAVILFIRRARPELLARPALSPPRAASTGPIVLSLALAALVTGGLLPWLASPRPDGLEWSIERAAGAEPVAAPQGGLHASLAALQQGVSLLPDYGFRAARPSAGGPTPAAWPDVNAGTSLAGIVGGVITLLSVWAVARLLRARR